MDTKNIPMSFADHFFREGGWGMYPTAILGFLLVACGIFLLFRPERRFVSLVVSLGVATMASGILGCAIGLANLFRYLAKGPPEMFLEVMALGCAQSINNIIFACIFVTTTSLLAAITAVRDSRSRPVLD